ncbi:MAG: hypothetical protein U0M48_05650 [Xylanibacter rarus]
MKMEQHTLENLHEDFETGVWKVRKFILPNASEYLWDIDNIRWAETGLINAFGSNRFFDEASQMIANSIYLFQEGFFDAAFYSLRQSIEISIGTLYLTANPEKINEWKKLEPGFESGRMANFLQEQEPIFKEIRTKMSTFFDNIHAIQKKTNKYVHKQGFFSFYTTQRLCLSDHREKEIYNKIVTDFEETLKVAIGAVAVYRLAIDPLPIILMDTELMTRSGDFVTEPYSKEFVDKYIGLENIKLYKQTKIYQDYKEWLMSKEKQNEAVYNIIHWQIIDRNKINDILEQIHLLSFTDRIAVAIIMSSMKIPQVFINGCFHYSSDVRSLNADTVVGYSYYNAFFIKNNNNFNIQFNGNAYISRIKINNTYSYIESNAMLDYSEINTLNYIAEISQEAYIKQETRLNKWLKEHKDKI